MKVNIEAAWNGVGMGEDTLSADDFEGISEAPERLQKEIKKALAYARTGE